MPYYDPDEDLTLQMCDRLRDLMEADSLVQSVYPHPIQDYWNDDLTPTPGVAVSIAAIAGDDFNADRTTGYELAPRFVMMIHVYSPPEVSQREKLRLLRNVTGKLRLALLRYLTDPTPQNAGGRLWHQMRFAESEATQISKVPKKFWYSVTLFQLFGSFRPE